MKMIIATVMLSVASLSSAMAASFTCSSAPDSTGGFTSVTITTDGEYSATIKGLQSGGEAQFARPIGPFNLKVSHDGDAVIYSNKEEKIELSVVTLGLNGKVISTASLNQGFGDNLSMNCKAE